MLEEDGALVTASRDKTAKLWLPEAAASTPPPPDARGFVDAATYAGHTDYVVALARVPQSLLPQGLIPAVGARGCLVTGSRDATLRLWRADDGAPLSNGAGGEDDDKGAAALRLVGHSYQVTGCGALPNGDVVSCALDKTARVWRLPQGKCCSTLEGHEGPVLCLAVAPRGLGILTGGGDGTARLWAWSPTATRGTCRAVFTGHTDTVRGLCVVPTGGEEAGGASQQLLRFATASHDCTLRVWTHDLSSSPSGTAVVQASPANSAELRGHTAIIYSVACSGDGRLLASGAEDNTVRLWAVPGMPGGGGGAGSDCAPSSTTNECLQVIAHPGCVWHVAFDPRPASAGGGDLFTACSDAVARAFSRDATRHAPEADREALSAAVAAFGKQAEAQAAKAQEAAGGGGEGGGAAADAPVPGLPPGVKVHDATVLTAPGRKDGEVAVVRESDGAVNAYSWDAGAGTWEKVGEVVAAPAGGAGGAGAGGGGGNTIAGGGRKWHGGREWDFVFDVDAGDGGPMRRLACDRGENPYIVADRFLAQEDLPSSADFKEQIVRFIEQNTAGATGGAAPQDLPITGGGADPFTGGGGGGGSGLPRPAYVPPPRPTDITGGFVDPFTGGAAGGVGGGGGGASAAAPAALPWLTFLLFNDALAADKVGAKVRELSAALGGGEHALTEAEMGAPLVGLLQRAAAAAATGAAATTTATPTPLPADQAAVLAKMLRWPPASVFPVLDLARCLALERAPAVPLGDVSAAAGGSSGTAGGALAAVAATSPPPAAALTTALRFASNAFFSDSARAWALGQRESLLSALAEAIGEAGASNTNKASRLALATLLLNYSAAAAGAGAAGDDDERLAAGLQLASLANELARALPADGSEDEAARRAVVAVATAVAAGGGGTDGSGAALRDAARAMDALVAAARRLPTAPAAAGSGVDGAAVAAARAVLLG